MTDTITLPRSVLEQALGALKIGHESAHDCAETFHIEMAGYKQQRHEALDAEVKQISDAIGVLRAALDQPQDHPEQYLDMVPEGWKLVPVEPTTKMIDAARSQSSFPAGVWRAMLAAAPQPPVVEQPQGEQEPICWVTGYYGGHCTVAPCNGATVLPVGMALYTHPQPKREPLTEMEIVELRQLTPGTLDVQFVKFARSIEAAHGVKGRK